MRIREKGGTAAQSQGGGRTHVVFAQCLQVARSRREPTAGNWEVRHHCNTGPETEVINERKRSGDTPTMAVFEWRQNAHFSAIQGFLASFASMFSLNIFWAMSCMSVPRNVEECTDCSGHQVRVSARA